MTHHSLPISHHCTLSLIYPFTTITGLLSLLQWLVAAGLFHRRPQWMAAAVVLSGLRAECLDISRIAPDGGGSSSYFHLGHALPLTILV